MSKLFNAYFSRLGKWKVFRILMLLMFVGCTAVAIALRKQQIVFNLPYTLSYLIFPHYVGIIIGLFNYPLLSNGTIRNQIIVGHSRIKIYIADWAASNTLSVALYLIAAFCLIAVAAIAGDPSGISVKAMTSGIVLSALQVIFFTTITQLFCVVLKGVKSFLAIYLGNQLIVLAGVGLMNLNNIPKALYYFAPTAVCMQLNSFGIQENNLFMEIENFGMSFHFLPAAAAMLFETALVFTIGILYFRKTNLN